MCQISHAADSRRHVDFGCMRDVLWVVIPIFDMRTALGIHFVGMGWSEAFACDILSTIASRLWNKSYRGACRKFVHPLSPDLRISQIVSSTSKVTDEESEDRDCSNCITYVFECGDLNDNNGEAYYVRSQDTELTALQSKQISQQPRPHGSYH